MESSELEWWAAEAWWLKQEYARLCPWSPGEISGAVAVMQRDFARDWWEGALRQEPYPGILPHLLGKGSATLTFIVSLGRDLEVLEDVEGLDQRLLQLKQNEGLSVLLEIQTAAIFARCGWRVRFVPRAKSKTPDIEVELAGETAAIECKRLEREEWRD